MVLSLIFAAAAALSNSDVFMQRLADSGAPQMHKTVTVGALPPNWTAPAPLPQGVPLLGAVTTRNANVELYYAPTYADAASQQYVSQLRAAGYHEFMGVVGSGGFSRSQMSGNLTVMCEGNRGVSIRVPQPGDLRVDFAAPTAIGACVQQQPRFTTPVPNLLAPAGTRMTSAGASGGMTYAVGSGSSLFSSARFKTPLSAKQLLAALAAQMRAAKWSALPPFASPQGAAQQFTYDNGGQHWSSTLVIFRERAAHTYEGRVEASGTPQLDTQVSALPAMAVAPTLSASKIPRALALAQRIAGAFASGGGSAQIVVGALPRAFDRRIPLPSGSLVGSVSSDTQASVFYDLTRAQFDAWVSALHARGWGVMPMGPPSSGFAVLSSATYTTFCKAGMPLVTTQVQAHTNDVRIGVGKEVQSTCSSPFETMAMQFAPLPPLHAPDGVRMTAGSAGVPGGTSGASLQTAQPLSAVLGGFASEMTAKGWRAGVPVVSDAVGSQSFAYTDANGKRWQAVLTIYRSDSERSKYYAFIDTTAL